MSKIEFRVIAIDAPGGEEDTKFDTAAGDSDSYVDARRVFNQVCSEMASSGNNEGAVLFFKGDEEKERWEPKSKKKEQKKKKVSSEGSESAGEEKKTKKPKTSVSKPASQAAPKKMAASSAATNQPDTDTGKGGNGGSRSEGPTPKVKKGKVAKMVDMDGSEIEPPKNAYQIFCAELRPKLKAELEQEWDAAHPIDPSADAEALKAADKEKVKSLFGDCGKKLAAAWAELDVAAEADETAYASGVQGEGTGKARYKAMAEADKERYEAAVAGNPDNAAILASRKSAGKRKASSSSSSSGITEDAEDHDEGGDDDNDKPAKGKKAKAAPLLDSEGNEIKKPLTAFFHFSGARRPAVKEELAAAAAAAATDTTAAPKYDVTLVAKRLGELWKSMDAEGKSEFETLALEDKQRYEAAVASNSDNAWVGEAKTAKADAKAKKAEGGTAAASEKSAAATEKAEAKAKKSAAVAEKAAAEAKAQPSIASMFGKKKPAAKEAAEEAAPEEKAPDEEEA